MEASGAKLLKEVFGGLHRAFPDLRVTAEDVIAEGDKVVVRNSVTGTHQGEYMGVPPTGRSVTYDEIFIARFSDGRIAETWGVVDVLSQMRQLGAIPDDGGTRSMAPQAILTGQDVGEAEGALTALLSQVLADTETGITRTQYIAMRVVALRGPFPSPAALHDLLAGQPQLGLDRSQVAELLHGLEARGLVTGSDPDGPGPTTVTPRGAELNATLAGAVAGLTQRLYAGLDSDELATAHRVLVEVSERANRLRRAR
jgi:DNA-binding MarR family transcriptional regulator